MNPLHIPAFRAYMALRFFMASGWYMQTLIVSWTIWSITRDPLMLGMVGLAEAIPAIGIALPMGYLVDKLEKRRAITIAAILILVSAVCTAFAVQPQSIAAIGNHATVSVLLAFVVVNGAARTLYSPSMFSVLSAVIPTDVMPRAAAISSAGWQGAMMIGPMVGGLLYGAFGVLTASIVTLACMVIGACAVMYLPRIPATPHTNQGSLLSNVSTGLRFIFSNQIILGALSLDMFAVLFGGAVALLPVFADTILHVDAGGLGMLRAAPSVGSVLTMSWLSMHPPTRNTGRTLIIAVVAFGLATIAFAISTNFILSLAILCFIGAADAVSVVVRHTILQLHTPEEVRGRVSAANTMFISSSNEIGSLESGVAASLIGTVPSVIFGGVMTLIVVTVVAIKAPILRRMQLTDE